MTDEPWKKTLIDIWDAATLGKRWIAVAAVLVAIVIPGFGGVVSFYVSTWAKLATALTRGETTLSPGEATALDEWVAVVAHFSTKEAAEVAEKEFRLAYLKYETVKRADADGLSYALWRDDIFVVRDPQRKGYLLIIDTFYGTSSEPAVSGELARLNRLGGQDPAAQNTYQRMFVNSHALCYSKHAFEMTYGRILPEPKAKIDPPCRS